MRFSLPVCLSRTCAVAQLQLGRDRQPQFMHHNLRKAAQQDVRPGARDHAARLANMLVPDVLLPNPERSRGAVKRFMCQRVEVQIPALPAPKPDLSPLLMIPMLPALHYSPHAAPHKHSSHSSPACVPLPQALLLPEPYCMWKSCSRDKFQGVLELTATVFGCHWLQDEAYSLQESRNRDVVLRRSPFMRQMCIAYRR